MISPSDATTVHEATVYKNGVAAASLARRPDGSSVFCYLDDYVANSSLPVATTLPLSDEPIISPHGAVPAFFAGLLPEGRRLTAVRNVVKTSLDDEYSLLMAVGADPVGDVQIIAEGSTIADSPPLIDLGNDAENLSFEELAAETDIIDPSAIAGVQDKASAAMITVPARRAGRKFILKLNPPEYPGLVENELLFLGKAKALGIPVASSQLVRDRRGVAGLLVERFDRTPGPGGTSARIAMEDASQVLGLTPANKYTVSAERLGNAVADLCAARRLAARNVYLQFLFAWLTGNGDLHAKNISILNPKGDEWTVSPVYDVPSTLPYGDATMALTICGKDKKLSRSNWLEFASHLDLPRRLAERCMKTASEASAVSADELPFEGSLARETAKQLRWRRAAMEN